MAPGAGDPPDPKTVRCPTCRAVQDWSDTCRRCKCDLRLLRTAASSYARARREALAHLRAGRSHEALRAARRTLALHPDADTRRTLALAALLCGDSATAAGSIQQRET